MPGKPRLPVPGFLRLRELAEEAKRQDIPLSLSGLKRQIELGQIQPDSYEQRVYKPSPLFRRDQLATWLLLAPKKAEVVPAGFSTSHTIWQQARRINPKICFAHVQQFLKRALGRARDDLGYRQKWEGAYIEFHGRRRRLIIPQAIADEFYRLAQEKRLAGLFVDYGHSAQGPSTPACSARRVRTKHRRPRRSRLPNPMTPVSFEKLGSRFSHLVVRLRLLQMKKMESGDLVPEAAAYYLGMSVKVVAALVETGQLQMRRGKVTLKSMSNLF